MKMTNSEKLDITVTAENCDNEDCFCGYFNDSGVNAGECSPQQVINELNYMYRSLVNKIDTGNGDSDVSILAVTDCTCHVLQLFEFRMYS